MKIKSFHTFAEFKMLSYFGRLTVFLLLSFNAVQSFAADKVSKKKLDERILAEERKYNFETDTWLKLASEAEEIGYDEAQAKCLNNVGFILSRQGKNHDAIEYYRRALDIFRNIDSKSGMAGAYNDMAGVYSDIKEKKKAEEYYHKAYDLYLEVDDKPGISLTAHNISVCYLDKKEYKAAKKFALKALNQALSIGDSSGLPSILTNLGSIYEVDHEVDSAMNCYYKAYSISEKYQIIEGIAFVGLAIGQTFISEYESGKVSDALLDSAEYYLKKSLDFSTEVTNLDGIKRSSFLLMKLYKLKEEWEKAYYFTEKYYAARDTLENVTRQKEILKSQMDYEHNLEILKAEEKNKADKAIADEEAAKQRVILIASIIVIFFLIVFVMLIVKKWNQTKEQKVLIEHQKELVEEKQKEIMDSINYAQRLQQAILVNETEIVKYFPNSFLFYKPKDIVAGDFYFFEKTATHIFYAAADCTGHGVPGAMMSIVCSNALTKCVKEFNLTEPGSILDKTRELIVETFQKSGQDVKDGMDISLLVVRVKNGFNDSDGNGLSLQSVEHVKWAGANNPLWFIENKELKEIKPDKQPIGKMENPQPFTSHILSPYASTFFLFTDGFADQFGGEKGKKYKYVNLQKLLANYEGESPAMMYTKLESEFQSWKGNLEQVDDVCVIGIKLE